jgi:predicted nucleotidyltransferase
VFALPAVWTVRDAEHYALGGVSLLMKLGATHLAFGAETESLEGLRRLAERMEKPGADFQIRLKSHLASGCGYPRALQLAAAEENPEDALLLEKPNNILAICYLRAIRRLEAELEPVLIPRHGAYHADRIDAREPSASAIRDSLLRGNYGEAYEAVTGESAQILRKAFLGRRIPDPKCLDALLIQRLRRSTKEELRRLPDLSEGLEDRLAEAAGAVNTRGELLDAVSTRRYPRARISRICTASLLGMTREQLDREPLPEQAVLLGLRKHPGMTALWREKQDLISREWRHETDLLAWKTWALCAGLPDTLPRSERVIVYPPSGPASGEDG